jgi:alpha-glucosidase
VTVVANTGAGTAPLPEGTIALRSGEVGDGVLPGDTTVWIIETAG